MIRTLSGPVKFNRPSGKIRIATNKAARVRPGRLWLFEIRVYEVS